MVFSANIIQASVSGSAYPVIRRILSAVEQPNQKIVYVDGADITTKDAFLKGFADGLNFPDYFGHNWDAFEECLMDLSWWPHTETIVVYDQPNRFITGSPDEAQIGLSILSSAAEHWKRTGLQITLVFLNPDLT